MKEEEHAVYYLFYRGLMAKLFNRLICFPYVVVLARCKWTLDVFNNKTRASYPHWRPQTCHSVTGADKFRCIFCSLFCAVLHIYFGHFSVLSYSYTLVTFLYCLTHILWSLFCTVLHIYFGHFFVLSYAYFGHFSVLFHADFSHFSVLSYTYFGHFSVLFHADFSHFSVLSYAYFGHFSVLSLALM